MPTSRRCPNCGAGLEYLSKARAYYCRYCRTEFDDPDAQKAEEKRTERIENPVEVMEPAQKGVEMEETEPESRKRGTKYFLLTALCVFWIYICFSTYADDAQKSDFIYYLIIASPALIGLYRLNRNPGKRRKKQ